MLQNAAKLWGLKNVQAVDPFVKLLIEAFSTEIFKVNNEVQSNQERILERISRILIPSTYTFPRPAHAIAFTTTDESLEIIPDHDEFFVKKFITSSIKAVADIQVDVAFTPIDNIAVVNAQVTLIMVNKTCYVLDDGLNKQPLARLDEKEIEYNTLVLAIDATGYTNEKLERLTLFCSNPAYEHLDWLYKLLPFIEISSYSNQEISIKSGITYESTNELEGYAELIQDYAINKKIQENIKSIYAPQFLELTGFSGTFTKDEHETPDELQLIAQQPELKKILSKKKMIWLKLKFPPQFTPEILDSFSFALNAFPVYNRTWKQNQSSLDITGNNIPLLTGVGEHFLFVNEVTDGKGHRYAEIPFTQGKGLKAYTYSIRLGGLERFNNRNALDQIAHVLELTRDEVAAFGNLERDTVIGALEDMTIHMQTLNRKLQNVNAFVNQEMNYVIVEATEDMEHIYVSYWVSNCQLANNIRVGVVLTQQKRTLEKNRTIRLLTESIGGEQEQKGIDAIQAFKFSLTTRDKIVSTEDIKSFCRLLLKDQIKEINVKRGTIVSSKPKEGFIRTIEAEIVPHDYGFMGEKYWNQKAKELKNQITLKAIDGIEYVVKFLNKDKKAI